VKRQRNRAGRLFCTGARSLVQSVDKALGGFYRRLAARKGGLVAMKALARKLAGLYYRVLRYGLEYAEQGLQKTTPVMRKASGGSSSSWRPSKDSNSSPHPSHRQEK
jgi:hypothetical protein